MPSCSPIKRSAAAGTVVVEWSTRPLMRRNPICRARPTRWSVPCRVLTTASSAGESRKNCSVSNSVSHAGTVSIPRNGHRHRCIDCPALSHHTRRTAV